MKTLKEHIELQEANLSRILKHMQNHDSGGITAWRSAKDCGKGKPYTRKENQARLHNLKAKLLAKGYGVIATLGEYPEGEGVIKNENSYFVFDQNDTGNLKKDLIAFGKMFQQDSILFVPKGGKSGILYPTNDCDNNWLKKPENIGGRFMGKKGKYGSSKVKDRPWAFGDIGEQIMPPGNGLGWMALNIAANKTWQEHMEWDEQ